MELEWEDIVVFTDFLETELEAETASILFCLLSC